MQHTLRVLLGCPRRCTYLEHTWASPIASTASSPPASHDGCQWGGLETAGWLIPRVKGYNGYWPWLANDLTAAGTCTDKATARRAPGAVDQAQDRVHCRGTPAAPNSAQRPPTAPGRATGTECMPSPRRPQAAAPGASPRWRTGKAQNFKTRTSDERGGWSQARRAVGMTCAPHPSCAARRAPARPLPARR